jgi:hypothetical protein
MEAAGFEDGNSLLKRSDNIDGRTSSDIQEVLSARQEIENPPEEIIAAKQPLGDEEGKGHIALPRR